MVVRTPIKGEYGVVMPSKIAKEVEALRRLFDCQLNKRLESKRNEIKEENSNADQDPNYN